MSFNLFNKQHSFFRNLADSSLVPYSIDEMPKTMNKALQDIKEKGIDRKLIAIYDKYGRLFR